MRVRCNYQIVWAETTPQRLVLRDCGPWTTRPTITNDIEAVVDELYRTSYLWPERNLFYYDSEGELTKVLHRAQAFVGYAPAFPADVGKGGDA
jgi:hypothetical protein